MDTSSLPHQALCTISKPSVNLNLSYTPETLNSGQNWLMFVPCYLEMHRMLVKNNRAPLLYYVKLCVSFQSHQWIQTPNSGHNWPFFLSCVTLKFDGWPWKIIGHLFSTTSNFVYYFKAIGEFKLKLQSRNAPFGSKLAIILSHVTLKCD